MIGPTFHTLFDSPLEYVHAGLWKPRQVHVFVHLPKTAGMALGHELQQLYERQRICAIQWDNIGPDWQELLRSTEKYDLAMGHLTFAQIKNMWRIGTPSVATTLVRHPISRLLSEYNYSISVAHPPHLEFREKFPTFEAFAKSQPANVMARKLVGDVYNINDYWAKLAATYQFVGLQEHFDLSVAALRGALGFGFVLRPTQQVNSATNPVLNRDGLSSELMQYLSEMNSIDMEMFEKLEGLYADLQLRLSAMQQLAVNR